MSTIKVDTIATRTGSGNITVSNALSGTDIISTTNISDNAITNAKIANSTLDLTAKVTGSLPVANGGTSLSRAPAYCSAYISGGDTGGIISPNTWTTAPMQSTYFDNYSGYNTSSYRYTIPYAGKYMIHGSVDMRHNSGSGQSNQHYIGIFVNGSEVTALEMDSNGNYHWTRGFSHFLTKTFAQGDYIELKGICSAGNGLTNSRFRGGRTAMTVMELFGV